MLKTKRKEKCHFDKSLIIFSSYMHSFTEYQPILVLTLFNLKSKFFPNVQYSQYKSHFAAKIKQGSARDARHFTKDRD